MRRHGFVVSLLFAGTAMLTLAAPPAVAQTTAARDPAFVDLKVHNDEIEAWRKAQYEAARRQGNATAAEFRRIDTEALQRARAAEIHRTGALDALSKTAKVPLGQGPGGTQPSAGRGTLGDIDTASLSGNDFNEVQKAAKKAGYTVVQQGDAFTIKELDVTVHRAPAVTGRRSAAATIRKPRWALVQTIRRSRSQTISRKRPTLPTRRPTGSATPTCRSSAR